MNTKLKTMKEVIQNMGISKSAFYRRAKRLNLTLKHGLITPDDENQMRRSFGLPELPVAPLDKGGTKGNKRDFLGQNGTNMPEINPAFLYP
jgi:hypothetical protein